MAWSSSSDTERELFLTQSTFQPSDSGGAETQDDYFGILSIHVPTSEEEIYSYNTPGDDFYKKPQVDLRKLSYQPIVSDFSDDELLQASLAVERQDVEGISGSGRPDVDEDDQRFEKPKGDDEMSNITRRRLADSTRKKTKWALDLFRHWQAQRNKRAINDPSLSISPINVRLEDMTKDELNYSISRFLCEVRKQNCEHYPGQTLHELVICIQLYFDTLNRSYKFLQDPHFIQIKNTLDGLMKDRASAGLGSKPKQAQVISVEEEEQMWSSGVLGSENPTQLLNTLVYLLGLNFALRGGQEHRNLRHDVNSQLSVITEKDGSKILRYTEDVSKANQGGLKHRNIKPKVVDAFQNTANPSRCVVRLYEKYIEHCPAKRATDALYLRPLAKTRGKTWYTGQQLGRHKLSQVVTDLCKKAGLPGYRTNHSLRATAATRMFEKEVDEQLICEVTGHRSHAVRNYKRTSDALKRKANCVVQGISGEGSEQSVIPSGSSSRYKQSRN